MFDLPGKRTEGRGQRTDFKAQGSKLKAQGSKLKAHHRRGVTLIELLVVISIMLLLAAYALPKLAPMARERKIREAARSVSVFLSRARSRAIETGRPCGVVFQRVDVTDPNDPLTNAATMLYQAEVPPPYAGDTLDTRVTVTELSPGAYQANVVSGSIQPGLLRVGDLMQINSQGPWYTITGPNTNPVPVDGLIGAPGDSVTQLGLSIDLQYQGSLPWPSTAELPFKILRRPVRTIARPLSLPVGTAIDLSASGTDQIQDDDNDGSSVSDQTFSTGSGDVVIMFSPNGSVSRYYWDIPSGPKDADATDPIFLLVGWRENIELAPQQHIPGDSTVFDEEELPNWQILANLWIGLNPQSGLVTVAENAFPQQTYTDAQNPTSGVSWSDGLIEARQYARRAQSKGGR